MAEEKESVKGRRRPARDRGFRPPFCRIRPSGSLLIPSAFRASDLAALIPPFPFVSPSWLPSSFDSKRPKRLVPSRYPFTFLLRLIVHRLSRPRHLADSRNSPETQSVLAHTAYTPINPVAPLTPFDHHSRRPPNPSPVTRITFHPP